MTQCTHKLFPKANWEKKRSAKKRGWDKKWDITMETHTCSFHPHFHFNAKMWNCGQTLETDIHTRSWAFSLAFPNRTAAYKYALALSVINFGWNAYMFCMNEHCLIAMVSFAYKSIVQLALKTQCSLLFHFTAYIRRYTYEMWKNPFKPGCVQLFNTNHV